MTKPSAHDPHKPDATQTPANQTRENQGRIKRPQRTEASEEDMPRGSESEHQGGPRTRH